MTAARTLLRVALPPTIALGLVAVASAPLSPSSALADTGSQVRHPHSSPAPSTRANLAVGIGDVSFSTKAAVIDGHLHAAVLLAAADVSATAWVSDASTGPGCEAELTPGNAVWLDCDIAVAPEASPRIVVSLSDGRTATAPIN